MTTVPLVEFVKMLLIIFTVIAYFLGSSQCSQELTLKSTLTGQGLDLTCTLHNAHADNISHVISVVISKSAANQDEVLASALSVGGASPVTHHLEDAVVTSDLTWDGNSDSFLSIHWSREAQALDGNYSCMLNGLNQDNIPITLVSMVTVSTDPALVATPLVIEVGLTKSLSLNCSLLDQSLLHLTTVSLIELSNVHDGIDQLLASVSPDTGPELEPGSGASKVTGALGNQKQGSYLEAIWQSPDVANTGEYVCEIAGVDSSGLPVLFRTSVNVTAKELSMEDLVHKIDMLQSENNKLQADKQSLEECLVVKTPQTHDINTMTTSTQCIAEDQYQNALQDIKDLEDLYHSAMQNITLLEQLHQPIKNVLENTPCSNYNYACDFDSGLCEFVNADPRVSWYRHAGRAPTWPSSGPQFDHTSGGGYYMYINSDRTDVQQGEVARLARAFPADTCTLLQQACLSFWYYMGGYYNSATLKVYIQKDGKESLYFTRTGMQDGDWLQAFISLTAVDLPFSLIFEAIWGDNGNSDIAIDDINIASGKLC